MTKFPLKDLRAKRFGYLDEYILDLLDIHREVFLAGGAVRALITNEKPADYDLFFKSQEAVTAVREELEADGCELKFECPEGKLFTYVKTWEDDYYAGTPEYFQSIKIQLILDSIGGPEQIIEGFDFNACRAAIDNDYLYCDIDFIRDVVTKELSMHRVTYPVATLKRFGKYARKGYNINKAAKQFVEEILLLGRQGAEFSDEELRVYID